MRQLTIVGEKMDIENLSIKDIKNLIITTKDEDKKELWQST